jgi:hypothetical protein
MRFEVKLGNDIIGFTELEAGDAPMGVACGRFVPTPAYASIQSYCKEHRESWAPIPELSIAVTGSSLPIECSGTITVEDCSVELGEIEISIHGVPYPLYAELFPNHVESYKKAFEPKA